MISRTTIKRLLPDNIGILFGVAIAAMWLLPSLLGDQAFFPADYWFRFSQWTPVYSEYYKKSPFNGVLYDVALHVAPNLWVARESWANFDIPLWNHYFRCGMPHLANGQSGIFAVTNIPMWLFPWPTGFAWAALARFSVMWTGSWLFARKIGINPIIAFGVAFGLCFMPAFMSWFQHPNVNSQIWFPFLLWSVEVFRQRWQVCRVGPYVLLPGLFFGLALFGGHFHSTFNITICATIYAFVALPGSSLKSLIKSRAVFTLSLIGGLLFAAPTVFPGLTFLFDSSTLQERTANSSGAWTLPGFFLELFTDPFAYGTAITALNKPWSAEANWAVAQQYIGIAPLVLLIVGLIAGRQIQKEKPLTAAGLASVAIFGGSMAFGWFPIYDALIKFPPFSFNTNPYFAIGLQAGIIVLAGFFWRDINRPAASPGARPLQHFVFIGCVVITIAMTVVLFQTEQLNGRRPELALTTILFAVGGLLIARGQFQGRVAMILIVSCWIADVLPVWKDYYEQEPKEWAMPETAKSNVISKIKAEKLNRVISDACYAPNTLAFFGIEDVRAYDYPIHWRHTLWRSLFTNEGNSGVSSDNLNTAQLSDMKALSILMLTGSKGLVSLVDYRQHPFAQYVKPLANDFTVKLYELKNPIQPAAAYPINGVQTVSGAAEAKEHLMKWDITKPYVPQIETLDDNRTTSIAATPIVVQQKRNGSNRIDFTLEPSSEPVWVVVRESFDRGWKAESGGDDLEVSPADIKFMAVKLPPGTTEFQLKYSPNSFWWGVFVSGLLIVLIICGVCMRPFIRGSAHRTK